MEFLKILANCQPSVFTMKTIKFTIVAIITIAGLLALGSCGRTSAPVTNNKPAVAATKIDYKPYPFDTSVVSDTKLDAHPIVFVQNGYEIKVSSQSEEDAFMKDPTPFEAKINQAYADAKPYPLDTCLVCGMKLDDDDITFVYEGRQFKVCGGDEDCFAVFQQDPDKYVKKWDDAAAKGAATTAK